VPSRRSLTLAGTVTTIAGTALFVWLVWNAGPQAIWRGLGQVGWGIFAIIAIAGLRFAVRAAGWIRCLEPPHTLKLSEAFTAVVSGDALGNATPLGPLVSEPAKVAFVRTRVPLGVAFTALAIENLFYTLSVVAMIAAAMTALLLRGGLARDLQLAAEVATVAVLVAYAGLAWALWRKPALLSSTVALAGRVTGWTGLTARLDKVRRLEQDIYTFAARRRQAVGALIPMELAFHALGVAEVHLTLWLLLPPDQAPSLVTSFILETTNRLIIVLFKFVPMQQPGVSEVGTVLVAQLLGISAPVASTLVIVRRARMIFWQLAGTALLVRHGVTTRRILDDAELSPEPAHLPSSH
jgi:hypothetical protein